MKNYELHPQKQSMECLDVDPWDSFRTYRNKQLMLLGYFYINVLTEMPNFLKEIFYSELVPETSIKQNLTSFYLIGQNEKKRLGACTNYVTRARSIFQI